MDGLYQYLTTVPNYVIMFTQSTNTVTIMHFQTLLKQAREEAEQGGIELALYLDPVAEYETDQLGYCPTMALELFPYYVIVGYVSPTGDYTLRN